MLKISKKLVEKIKLAPERQYRIAQKAGIHPSTLSKLICGIEQPREQDPRVLKIGKVLGISKEEVFEDDE